MALTQTHHICVHKGLLSNYFIIILISHIVHLLLIRKFYCFRPVCIFPLNMRDIIIYVAQWWEKYLSKCSLIKHTCSWRDKLIVLWKLNRQAKILLHKQILLINKISYAIFYIKFIYSILFCRILSYVNSA